MSKPNLVSATCDDVFSLYMDSFPPGELERIVGMVFGWDEIEDARPVTPTEFGQIVLARWMRFRLPTQEMTRQAVLRVLGERERFVASCERYARNPEAFSGYLISWFDDKHMALAHEEHRFYDLDKGRWQPAAEKPKHTWMIAVDIAPLYVMGMQKLKERQDARDLKSSKRAEGDTPE